LLENAILVPPGEKAGAKSAARLVVIRTARAVCVAALT